MTKGLQVPTPLQEIHHPLLSQKKVKLWVKREDLVDPELSGNKWRKLHYNLKQVKEEGYQRLLTFGGAFSNHIYAVAAAGKRFGFETIGIIRGEQHEPLNPTLAFAQSCGMYLKYLDRSTYRQKHTHQVQHLLLKKYGRCYIIPEGGTNVLAVNGCAEIVKEIPFSFDYITTACGTGGTLAGLIAGLNGQSHAMGFPVLKRGHFLYPTIRNLLLQANRKIPDNWSLQLSYHFGGYAKKRPQLLSFIEDFESTTGISLEWIYTGKMFYGLFDLIGKNRFASGSKIIALHTGGLQVKNHS